MYLTNQVEPIYVIAAMHVVVISLIYASALLNGSKPLTSEEYVDIVSSRTNEHRYVIPYSVEL